MVPKWHPEPEGANVVLKLYLRFWVGLRYGLGIASGVVLGLANGLLFGCTGTNRPIGGWAEVQSPLPQHKSRFRGTLTIAIWMLLVLMPRFVSLRVRSCAGGAEQCFPLFPPSCPPLFPFFVAALGTPRRQE